MADREHGRLRMKQFNYELACAYICVIAIWTGIILLAGKSPHIIHETIPASITPTICFNTVDDVAIFYKISTKEAAKIEIPEECKQ